MSFKYLHQVGDTFWLDHRLTPEVSAMLCAMASRAPVGGVRARYEQIVETVASSLWEEEREADNSKTVRYDSDPRLPSWEVAKTRASWDVGPTYRQAEERLCKYPLHPRVQRFFDDFVAKYGHSSILELVGRPSIYPEKISWLTAWLLFDSPLCSGQEFSTRAVRHSDWPMARECDVTHHEPDFIHEGEAVHFEEDGIQIHAEPGEKGLTVTTYNPDFRTLHQGWFEVFEAEVDAWKKHLADPAHREALGIGDKEPFRPALDRARWALPGTISTGCSQTANLRVMARALREGSLLAQRAGSPTLTRLWEEITEAYREALPGLAGMGLREAVYGDDTTIPGHLLHLFSDAPEGPDAEIGTVATVEEVPNAPFRRRSMRAYIDPTANAMFRVNVTFRCSLAVARDWHRHRTLYPWHLQVVRKEGSLQIDHHYAPISEVGKTKVPELLALSTRIFDAYMQKGDVFRAALALPLGTRVRMTGQGGLRDVVYMLELRANAHGANFEYQEQARTALAELESQLDESSVALGFALGV